MNERQIINLLTIIGFIVGMLVSYFKLGYLFWPDSIVIGIVGAIAGALIGKIVAKKIK